MIRSLPLRACVVVLAVLAASCQREELLPDTVDATPPLPPAGIAVTDARDGYIALQWLNNREQDLAGYIIYRTEVSETRNFSPVDTVERNGFIDVARSYDTTYFYYVVALDVSGNKSQRSAIVSATSPNLSPPAPPDIVYASGFNDGTRSYIRIEWTPVAVADLRGYIIYRSETASVEPTSADSLTFTEGTVFDDSAIPSTRTTEYYIIVAVDRGGRRGEPSYDVHDFIADPPVLVSPSDNARVFGIPIFVWHAAPGAVEYRLTVSEAESGDDVWSTIIPDAGIDLYTADYNGPQLFVGRTYYWRVAALSKHLGRSNGMSPARIMQIAG